MNMCSEKGADARLLPLSPFPFPTAIRLCSTTHSQYFLGILAYCLSPLFPSLLLFVSVRRHTLNTSSYLTRHTRLLPLPPLPFFPFPPLLPYSSTHSQYPLTSLSIIENHSRSLMAVDEVEKSAFIAMCLGRKKELGQEIWTDAVKTKMTETMDKLPSK